MASWHLIDPDGGRSSGGAAIAPLLRLLPAGGAPGRPSSPDFPAPPRAATAGSPRTARGSPAGCRRAPRTGPARWSARSPACAGPDCLRRAARASAASAGAPPGTTRAPLTIRNQSWAASLPAPIVWTTASTQKTRGQAVDPAPARGADPVAAVVGQAEHGEAVAGDDPEPGPERPVGAGEGDRDPGQPRCEEGVAEQREAVEGDHRQRGQRERLVDRAEVALVGAWRRSSSSSARARRWRWREQRRAAGGPAGDPEEVRARRSRAPAPRRSAGLAAIDLDARRPRGRARRRGEAARRRARARRAARTWRRPRRGRRSARGRSPGRRR